MKEGEGELAAAAATNISSIHQISPSSDINQHSNKVHCLFMLF